MWDSVWNGTGHDISLSSCCSQRNPVNSFCLVLSCPVDQPNLPCFRSYRGSLHDHSSDAFPSPRRKHASSGSNTVVVIPYSRRHSRYIRGFPLLITRLFLRGYGAYIPVFNTRRFVPPIRTSCERFLKNVKRKAKLEKCFYRVRDS